VWKKCRGSGGGTKISRTERTRWRQTYLTTDERPQSIASEGTTNGVL
jgi:hypothetical protein